MKNFTLFWGCLVDFTAFSMINVKLVPYKTVQENDDPLLLLRLIFVCSNKYSSTSNIITCPMTATLNWKQYEKLMKPTDRAKDIVLKTRMGFETESKEYLFNKEHDLLNVYQKMELFNKIKLLHVSNGDCIILCVNDKIK